MSFVEYRRNLPHFHPDGAAIFLTWRLWGSLQAIARNTVLHSNPTPGRLFAAQDGKLDCASGPKWLADPPIAAFVAKQIQRGDYDRQFYTLHAWVIMPNHVHVLFTPSAPVPTITRWLKGSTANYANKILALTGSRFWRDESWDRSVRGGDEFRKITRYIEFNPVKAGLASAPEQWPYSSANR